MEKPNKDLFEKIVKIAQNRGFVFNASSIYGGLRSSYDYGPLGALLKENISQLWWKALKTSEVKIYPVDTAIIQSTDVWKASGHLSEFSDPMVECKNCNSRFRSDSNFENVCCDQQELTDPKNFNLSSLRILGTVGEPINPEAWMWYYKTVGNSKCPIVDTWWQTETGGILIAPQTGAIPLKPGSATKPFYGIKPSLVDKDGKEIKGAGEGRLCISQSWPGQMRTVYGDHQRFIDTYFSQFDGKYFTGDGCRRDKDGYYWITGRVDDVIIVSGHNLGTAEIESAFVAHPKVAEAAVVGYPHDIKGNGLYCYVTLNVGERENGDLERDLKLWVRKQIGPLATPDLIHFTPGLPKTRSGKIMRRILRKIATNEHGQLGDTTTLADPSVVQSLIDNRKNI